MQIDHRCAPAGLPYKPVPHFSLVILKFNWLPVLPTITWLDLPRCALSLLIPLTSRTRGTFD